MKKFRVALAGIWPAFVLLVCIQLNAHAACTPPPPDIQSWFTGGDTVNDPIWQPIGTLYNGPTYAGAKLSAPGESRQLLFKDRVAYQRAMHDQRTHWPGEAQAVWADSEMIVWGGYDGSSHPVDTGGRYCAQAGQPITLSGAGRKVVGINTVRPTWSGATSTGIGVYRDGTLIVTTPNDGSYLDSTGDAGRARYTYQVCEAGTQTCSNEATVTFSR